MLCACFAVLWDPSWSQWYSCTRNAVTASWRRKTQPQDDDGTQFFRRIHVICMLRFPTRWSQEVRHPYLSIDSDGRNLTFTGLLSHTFYPRSSFQLRLSWLLKLFAFNMKAHPTSVTKKLALHEPIILFQLLVGYSIMRSRLSIEGS